MKRKSEVSAIVRLCHLALTRVHFTCHEHPSLNTSCVEDTSPVSGPGRFSNRDSAKAFATLHASRELHQRNHAASTLPLRIMGTDSARTFANPRKKQSVSSDHLPQHLSSQHHQTGSSFFANELGWVLSFLRLQSWSAVVCSPPSRRSPPHSGCPTRGTPRGPDHG